VGKNNLKECIFDNMALYFECRIVKNALLQTVFSVILATGLGYDYYIIAQAFKKLKKKLERQLSNYCFETYITCLMNWAKIFLFFACVCVRTRVRVCICLICISGWLLFNLSLFWSGFRQIDQIAFWKKKG